MAQNSVFVNGLVEYLDNAAPRRIAFHRHRCPGGPPEWAAGKAVKNRRDPVTVIGDETHESHWSG